MLSVDVFRAVRLLFRERWFLGGAVLIFGVGVGIDLAVYAAIDPLVFRPLPYSAPGRLFFAQEVGASGKPEIAVTKAYVREMVARVAAVEGIGTVEMSAVGFTTARDTEGARALHFAEASASLLRTAGVRPVGGRDFDDADFRLRRRLVLLNYEAWKAEFGLDQRAIGRGIWNEAGERYEIAGVLPEGFIAPLIPFDPSCDGLLLQSTSLDTPLCDRWRCKRA